MAHTAGTVGQLKRGSSRALFIVSAALAAWLWVAVSAHAISGRHPGAQKIDTIGKRELGHRRARSVARQHAGRNQEQPPGRCARRSRAGAADLSEFPAGPSHQRRSAARALAAAEDDGRRLGRSGRPRRRSPRGSARAACALQYRASLRSRPALSGSAPAGAEVRLGRRHVEIDAIRLRESGWRCALPRRLLHHQRQERHRQGARRRQEDAGRRLSRHEQHAAREARRPLRRRRVSDQLSERVGPPRRTQRQRHLAARHAFRYLQPPAAARATAASC